MAIAKINGITGIAKINGATLSNIAKINGIVKQFTENFSTYTEVDPNSKLTVTASKITAANLLRNEDAYVYKDFGASYFNALDIDFEVYLNSASDAGGIRGAIGLTVSAVNDILGFGASDVGVYTYGSTVLRLFIGAASSVDSSVALSANTLYYCTLARTAASDTITCTIYSDSARTSVVDTLTLAGFGTGTRYRYLYGQVSFNSAETARADGYTQNMVIN